MENDRFKFRVWDKVSKKYRHYLYLDQCGDLRYPRDRGIKGCEMVTLEDRLNYTIEQCTGFRDKTGKLIYENDVLLFFERLRGVVKWEHGGWFVSGEGIYQPLCDAYASAEVVGNIHDAEAKGGEE